PATPVATPLVAPSVTPTQLAAETPSPTMAPPPAAVTTPSPTMIVAALDDQARQPPLSHSFTFGQVFSKRPVPILSGLALLVSVALIYVLTKLREKIRESSSG